MGVARRGHPLKPNQTVASVWLRPAARQAAPSCLPWMTEGMEGSDRSDRNEHGGTRTPDPQNRNLMLYPTELHAQTLGPLKEPIAGI